MIYLATGLVIIWSTGFLFLLGQALNFDRLILNNLAPGKNYWESIIYFRNLFAGFRLSHGISVDPANLTEIGRQYQKKAIRHQWIIFAWTIGGFILLVCTSSYFKGS